MVGSLVLISMMNTTDCSVHTKIWLNGDPSSSHFSEGEMKKEGMQRGGRERCTQMFGQQTLIWPKSNPNLSKGRDCYGEISFSSGTLMFRAADLISRSTVRKHWSIPQEDSDHYNSESMHVNASLSPSPQYFEYTTHKEIRYNSVTELCAEVPEGQIYIGMTHCPHDRTPTPPTIIWEFREVSDADASQSIHVSREILLHTYSLTEEHYRFS